MTQLKADRMDVDGGQGLRGGSVGGQWREIVRREWERANAAEARCLELAGELTRLREELGK